jgi:hypothetical protein
MNITVIHNPIDEDQEEVDSVTVERFVQLAMFSCALWLTLFQDIGTNRLAPTFLVSI